MATATICSTFNITLLGDLTAGTAANTFTTTRALNIVGITAINNVAANGALTVTSTTPAGVATIVTAVSAAGLAAGAAVYLDCTTATNSPAQTIALDPARASIAEGSVVECLDSANNLVSVVLHCIGNPSQDIPLT